MDSAVIGKIESGNPDFRSTINVVEQDGIEYKESIEIRRKNNNNIGGNGLIIGRAAAERPISSDVVRIDRDSGEITISEAPEKTTKYTEFAILSDEFVAVESGKGTFLFPLLEDIYPSLSIQSTNFDLDGFLERHSDLSPWQVGFYGRGGEAEKGVLYGEKLLSDTGIGDDLKGSQKNQIGVRYSSKSTTYKVSLTESGYLSMHQPSNIDAEEFIEYLYDEVLPICVEEN